MENHIACWESEIAKRLNIIRKNISGKGAKHSEVRICDNVIFCKLMVELTGMEVNLISHMQKSRECESIYYEGFRDRIKVEVSRSLNSIGIDVGVNDVYMQIVLGNRMSIVAIILDADLETMIRKGTVKLPSKGA